MDRSSKKHDIFSNINGDVIVDVIIDSSEEEYPDEPVYNISSDDDAPRRRRLRISDSTSESDGASELQRLEVTQDTILPTLLLGTEESVIDSTNTVGESTINF